MKTTSGDLEKEFNVLRVQLNESKLLQRHLKILQPTNHFFNRINERKINFVDVMRVLVEVSMKYNKRISEINKPTDFTFVRGKLCIIVNIEPNDKRVVGHLDDGHSTMIIFPLTVFIDNGIGGSRVNILRI